MIKKIRKQFENYILNYIQSKIEIISKDNISIEQTRIDNNKIYLLITNDSKSEIVDNENLISYLLLLIDNYCNKKEMKKTKFLNSINLSSNFYNKLRKHKTKSINSETIFKIFEGLGVKMFVQDDFNE